MPVYLYMRREDYSNHFMLVWNSAMVVKTFVDRKDWMEIHRSSCCPKKKAGKTSAFGKKCLGNFLDLGFCCAVSLTREGTSDGVAQPCMRASTMQNSAVLSGYGGVLTDFIFKTPVKWIDQKKHLFQDTHNLDQQESFECMPNTGTHLESKCGCHHDWHNSFH
jgi:hypothetical protein